MSALLRTAALAVLFSGAASAAAPATPAQRLRADVEERARGEIEDLFRTLCPEQCVLLGVQARVEDEPLGQGDPGFESLTGARAPVVRGVTASVVVDGKLPAAFRTRVKNLVAERVATLGAPATVNVDRVNFPVRNPPHLEAPERAPAPPSTEEPAQPEKPREERVADRLADAAPLLAVVALLAITVVVLGVLLYLASRRSAEPAWSYAAEGAETAAAASTAAPPRSEPFPAARARRLAKVLADERAVRNAVVRDALARGEAALVARWVRELGDVVVEDVRGDGELEGPLAALADELVRASPADPGARTEALQLLEGRVAAARLVREPESAEEAFAFLEGVRPDLYVAACRELAPGALEVALRFAPARLRAAALDVLPPGRRDEVALAWATRPEVSTPYALAAAEELRDRLAGTSGGATHAGRVLGELLDGMARVEQDALLSRIAAQGGRAGALPESALAAVPDEVLAPAALAVRSERLLAYLAGSDEDLRARVLSACPSRIRAELEEELQLGRVATRSEFLAGRRELLDAVRAEAARRGLSPEALRPQPARRLAGG